MRSTAEITDDNKVKLTIDIREDELSPFVEKSVKKLAREVRIPGFRPGKAPRKVVEARLGSKALRQDAIEEALESYYRQALLDNGIDAISPPKVDITVGEEEGDVSVEALIETRPTVSIEGYGGIEIEIPSVEIDEDDIDTSVRTLQEQYGTLEDVERPIENGDQVTLNIKVFIGDDEIEEESVTDLAVRVGRDRIDKELEEALTGSVKGDTLRISGRMSEVGSDPEVEDSDLDLESAEDDSSDSTESSSEVLTKDRVVEVIAVREINLPDPNDEFAAEVSEFDTIAKLREDIREQLRNTRTMMARSSYRGELIDKLVELVEPKDIPESLLAQQAETELHEFGHQLQGQGLTLPRYLEITGQGEGQLLAAVYSNASKSVLFDLALRAVAVSEDVEVTDVEIDAEIEKLSNSPSNEKAAVEEYYSQPERRLGLRIDLLKKKAFSKLLEIVSFKDTKGNVLTISDIDPEALGEKVSDEDGAE